MYESVCEAGTGRGILTAELCRHARYVVSYEVDKELFKKACAELQFQNLKLVNADLFKIKAPHFNVFVSNLPYSRSRKAFEWLATQKFNRAIVMVQKEFADKITANSADENYRAISVLSAHCFKMDNLFRVGRQSFEPRPMVESAVIRLTSVKTVEIDTIKNLNLLFSKRNKKASSLTARPGTKADFGDKRIDQLDVQDLIKIAEAIRSISPT